MNALPPHTLGLVSLSVSESGDRALFNTLEGATRLWDLVEGKVVGQHESFVKAAGKARQEPGSLFSFHPSSSPFSFLQKQMFLFLFL